MDRPDRRSANAGPQCLGNGAQVSDDRSADITQGCREARLQIKRQWHHARAAYDHEVVPQPQYGPQQRTGIGPRRQMRRALAFRFRAGRIQLGQRGADAILNPVQSVVVEPARQPRQQFGQRRRDQFEQPRGADADLIMRPRRQHDERDQKPGNRADRNLEHAIDRRIQRIDMAHARNQQHDDSGDRGCVKAGIDRCDESQRSHRQHQ